MNIKVLITAAFFVLVVLTLLLITLSDISIVDTIESSIRWIKNNILILVITFFISSAITTWIFFIQRTGLIISRQSGIPLENLSAMIFPYYMAASFFTSLLSWASLIAIALNASFLLAIFLKAIELLISTFAPIPYSYIAKRMRRRMKTRNPLLGVIADTELYFSSELWRKYSDYGTANVAGECEKCGALGSPPKCKACGGTVHFSTK